MKRGITHIAGPMIGFVQKCMMCSAILSDYRGAAVLETDNRSLPGWEVGAHVTVFAGNPTFTKLGEDEDAEHCAVDRILGPPIEPSAATLEALKTSLN